MEKLFGIKIKTIISLMAKKAAPYETASCITKKSEYLIGSL